MHSLGHVEEGVRFAQERTHDLASAKAVAIENRLKYLCHEKTRHLGRVLSWQGHVESNHDLRFWRPLY